MAVSHPSNITRAQTLRVVANLVELAENNGATIEAGIGVYGAGHATVTINAALDGIRIPHRDITAWQLATGTAWDVSSRRYEYQGVQQHTHSCDLTYQGVRIHLSMIEADTMARVAA